MNGLEIMSKHCHSLERLMTFSYGTSGQTTLTQGGQLALWTPSTAIATKAKHAPQAAVQYRELGWVLGGRVCAAALGTDAKFQEAGNAV